MRLCVRVGCITRLLSLTNRIIKLGVFISALLIILFIALGGGVLVGTIFLSMDAFDDGFIWVGVFRIFLGIVAMAALIWVFSLFVTFDSDEAEHCGPGTRYISETHYNPATKTTITDWMCVPI